MAFPPVDVVAGPVRRGRRRTGFARAGAPPAPCSRRASGGAVPSILLAGASYTRSHNAGGRIMLYMERFVMGVLLSARAVAYYATPFEVVTKLLVISGAISAVMFPAFSLSGVQDAKRSSILYRRTMGYTFSVLLPITLLLMLEAKGGLIIWLGPDFAANSARVSQFLLIGTFALGMEALPFVLIQGLGRPDIPAKLNLAEI